MKNLGINSCFTLVPALLEVKPVKIFNATENKVNQFFSSSIFEVAYSLLDLNPPIIENWKKDVAHRILEIDGLPT